MQILKSLCEVPTAPFLEHEVVRAVGAFVRRRPRLKLDRDRAGNLLIQLAGSSRSAPRLVFVAHMDHPGLASRGMLDSRTLDADFRGGVLAEYLPGTNVRFFLPRAGRKAFSQVRGRIRKVTQVSPRGMAERCTVAVESAVPANCIGMFDLPAARVTGRKFHSRACDDLAGCAAALAMLDQLHRRRPATTVAVLLTRAEEVGFIGALASVIAPALLRKSDRIISIETSAVQPYAQQTNGVILRVGDRTSIFNSSFMYYMHAVAEDLQKRTPSFRYQRSLMPGGSCEGTVFDAFGYIAGAVCVPLGNYHNMDKARRRIAAEYIDLGDWTSMVKLFIELANRAGEFRPGHVALQRRLKGVYRKQARRLRA